MMFSKSFGYALRGVLYVAMAGEGGEKIRVEDISRSTGIPKHFLGKIMNKLVKANMIGSTKGPSGGFYTTNETLDVPLIQIFHLFDGNQLFDSCVLHLKKCDNENICPLHYKVEETRKNIQLILSETTINNLLQEEQPDLLRKVSGG